MIIRAPFPPAQQIAHGQPRLNQPTSDAQLNLQAPLLQPVLHQDLFQKQIQFRGDEPFSQTVKEAFQEYFWGLKQQKDDEPPETMADIQKIVRMLWEDKKMLLEPDTLKALAKEKSSPEAQAKALEVMAGDMLLDKTKLKQQAIDWHLFRPTPGIPSGEAGMEQVAQQAGAALKTQYPFNIPVSTSDVEQRFAWITAHSPETIGKLKLKVIDSQLVRPVSNIPQGEAGAQQIAQLAEDILKKHHPFEIPISADDVTQRIEWMAKHSFDAKTKLKQQAINSQLFRPISGIQQGEAGAQQVAEHTEANLKKHHLFELPVTAEDVTQRLIWITAHPSEATTKLKVQAIDSQLSNPALKIPEEDSPVGHIARQAEEGLKKQYLLEMPITTEDVEQRIASLKKQMIDAHLEHPAFTVPKGESVAQYVAQKAQVALKKRFSFHIPVSTEDVEQQIALLAKNKPVSGNKAHTHLMLKRLGVQQRKSPLSG